jgi:GxxExxY protein
MMDIEEVASEIVDSAVKVHKALGPGLLESAYQQCLAYELHKRVLHVESEVPLPIYYDGVRIDAGYRADMIVENLVVIENKTVESLLPIHSVQLLTYLRLGGYKLGFLLNWNTILLKHGIKRIVNELEGGTYPKDLNKIAKKS